MFALLSTKCQIKCLVNSRLNTSSNVVNYRNALILQVYTAVTFHSLLIKIVFSHSLRTPLNEDETRVSAKYNSSEDYTTRQLIARDSTRATDVTASWACVGAHKGQVIDSMTLPSPDFWLFTFWWPSWRNYYHLWHNWQSLAVNQFWPIGMS